MAITTAPPPSPPLATRTSTEDIAAEVRAIGARAVKQLLEPDAPPSTGSSKPSTRPVPGEGSVSSARTKELTAEIGKLKASNDKGLLADALLNRVAEKEKGVALAALEPLGMAKVIGAVIGDEPKLAQDLASMYGRSLPSDQKAEVVGALAKAGDLLTVEHMLNEAKSPKESRAMLAASKMSGAEMMSDLPNAKGAVQDYQSHVLLPRYLAQAQGIASGGVGTLAQVSLEASLNLDRDSQRRLGEGLGEAIRTMSPDGFTSQPPATVETLEEPMRSSAGGSLCCSGDVGLLGTDLRALDHWSAGDRSGAEAAFAHRAEKNPGYLQRLRNEARDPTNPLAESAQRILAHLD